jgi:hypothetical protein
MVVESSPALPDVDVLRGCGGPLVDGISGRGEDKGFFFFFVLINN